MRIYYEHKTAYAAIYNNHMSTKIIVINLDNGKDIMEINNKYYVTQSLIYSNSKGDKKLLIAIDTQGIRFYNIEGYKTSWGFNDKGALIKYISDGPFGKADFIDENKIIFAYYYSLIVFELEDVKIPSIKFNYYQTLDGDSFICVLGLKNGNALIGTKYGYIYLIKYVNKDMKILDYKKICNNAVSSLSLTNNCYEYSESCYIFAANCGYIYVFEIANEEREDLITNIDNNIGLVILIIIVCVVIGIKFLYETYKQNCE